MFSGRVTPELPANALVHPFRQRFGQAVGQSFGENRGVVIMVGLQVRHQIPSPNPAATTKTPK